MNAKLLLVVAGTLALGLGACEEKKEAAAGVLDKAANATNKAVEATKDAATKGTEAVKDAAASGTQAVKDAAAKSTEAVKDSATKAADTAAAGWEAAKKAVVGENTTAFTDFNKQITDLSKKIETAPAEIKVPATTLLNTIKTQLTEGQTLLTSLTGSTEKDYKSIADRLGALVPQIKDGIAKLTAMLPK
jgi:hypothetical protein